MRAGERQGGRTAGREKEGWEKGGRETRREGETEGGRKKGWELGGREKGEREKERAGETEGGRNGGRESGHCCWRSFKPPCTHRGKALPSNTRRWRGPALLPR